MKPHLAPEVVTGFVVGLETAVTQLHVIEVEVALQQLIHLTSDPHPTPVLGDFKEVDVDAERRLLAGKFSFVYVKCVIPDKGGTHKLIIAIKGQDGLIRPTVGSTVEEVP